MKLGEICVRQDSEECEGIYILHTCRKFSKHKYEYYKNFKNIPEPHFVCVPVYAFNPRTRGAKAGGSQ